MDIFIIVAQFILSLSILIVLHEFGHFLPAKLFGTKVEKFYLFFDPWFSLAKKKIGDTVYGIGWLPLGGYVKIAGMIDESMDKEQMKEEPKEWEFRSKPTWQRLIIMLGGVTVNFLLGFLIFGLILFTYGEEYLPMNNAKYGIAVDSMGRELGLQDGDCVLSVGGVEIDRLDDRKIVRQIVLNDAETITVKRDGKTKTLKVPDDVGSFLATAEGSREVLFYPRVPYVVGQVAKDSPAEEAGFQQGDSIVEVDSMSYVFFDQYKEYITDHSDAQMEFTLFRDGNKQNIEVAPNEDGIIGLAPLGPGYFFDYETRTYGPIAAVGAGFTKGYTFLADQIKAFGQMFTGEIKASESLGGFVTIANLFPSEWDWKAFWTITAILSLILGFMNLLPIPALDGGHVMFLLYEMITGRKPSDKVMEYATLIGIILLLALLLYANGLDIIRALS